MPTISAEVEHVASPELNAAVPHPAMVVPPDLKSTVPPGLLPPVIVAVNVTESPTMLGFAPDVNPIVGVA